MQQDGNFGRYLLAGGFVTANDLMRARTLQRRTPYLRIGEILTWLGALGFEDLVCQLAHYHAQSRLGQILVSLGTLTPRQLEEALMRQAGIEQQLGTVLIEMGLCTLEQVLEALEVQRSQQVQPSAIAVLEPTLEPGELPTCPTE